MKQKTEHILIVAALAAGLTLPPLLFAWIQPLFGETIPVPMVYSIAQQVSLVVAGFVLKPLYQIISLIVIIMFWEKKEKELKILTFALIAFLIGENACAFNYLMFHEQSLFMEYLHSYGMAVCFGLAVYAVMETFDRRMLYFSDPSRPCTLLSTCGRCYKYTDTDCTLRKLFLFVVPATLILTALPLTATLGGRQFSGLIFGNTTVLGHRLSYQLLEVRFYPLMAIPFLIASFAALVVKKEKGFHLAKVFFAMGIGPLAFSLLRFFFYWGYADQPLWADVWEEVTEFLFIAFVLWISLRIRASSDASQKARVKLSSAEIMGTGEAKL